MSGFFKKVSKHTVSAPLKGFHSKKGCYTCKLYKQCKTPIMPVYGQGLKKILILGPAPSIADDCAGRPFSDEAGQYLDRVLYKAGIDLEADCWSMNAVNCCPTNKNGEQRSPTASEIASCTYKWKQVVNQLKPKKMILLGLEAIHSFLGGRLLKLGAMQRWVGWRIPDQTYKMWVFPTFDLSYVLENSYSNAVVSAKFEKDITEAAVHNKRIPVESPTIKLLLREPEIISYLESLVKKPPTFLAFDYETTGLKPHKKGHMICTIGVSTKLDSGVGFPFLLNSARFLNLWKQVMLGPSKKICQNWAMEAKWTEEICGYVPQYPALDTMLAAHVLDHRSQITGLKFQTYVNYGVLGYDDDVRGFLESKGKDGNGFNNIFNAPVKPLLKYVALDSVYTLKRFFDQTEELQEKGLDDPYDFFHDGMIVCHEASQVGMRIDTDYFEKLKKTLEQELVELETKIYSSKEHKKWEKVSKKRLDIASPVQVKKLIVDVLKIRTSKQTKAGNTAVDKEVLEQLQKKYKIFDYILQWRKKEKILSTYVLGLLREVVDGKIHPNINLHLTRTYRSSVDSPNFQNIPKRDKETKKLIRRGIIARKGHKIMAVDYSGAEIHSGCVYHKDSQMIDYVVHKKGDMHREYAAKLYLLPEFEITEDIRYRGKNNFIFPQFYGDWYVANAKKLWAISSSLVTKSGKNVRAHLKEKGFKTLSQYEQHVKEIEREFWEVTFPEYTQWKSDSWEEYQQTGYTKMLTGFVCDSVMNRKNIINYRPQGTAFHWLLWSMIEVAYHLKVEKLKSRLIMQIHDELLLDLVPSEEEKVYKLIKYIMTEAIKEHWPWISVPLKIQAEVSEVDGNWCDMQKISY